MKHTVKEAIGAIESWAPPEYAYDWDRQGLHLGDPAWPLQGVVVCLTISESTLAFAMKRKANFIVAHHPLFWEPLKTLRRDRPLERLCLNLDDARIACYSAHTNLDVAPGGVNDLLAQALGLRACRPLIPVPHARQHKLVTFVPGAQVDSVREALASAGAGVIGNYTHCSFATPGTGTFLPGDAAQPFCGKKGRVNQEPEYRVEMVVPKARLSGVLAALHRAHPYETPAYDVVMLENRDLSLGLGVAGELAKPVALDAWARTVRAALGCDSVRVVGPPRKRVRTVGVLGGGGASEIAELPSGIDVFVTGDVRYHDALHALNSGLALIDAGHAATENLMVPAMAEFLRTHLSGVPVYELKEPGPFRVL